MKFKENVIKSGMVIHCPKEEDARALLEHLEHKNYWWNTGECLDDTGMLKRLHSFYEGDRFLSLEIGFRKDDLSRTVKMTSEIPIEGIIKFSDLIESDDLFQICNLDNLETVSLYGKNSTQNSTDGEKSIEMTNQRAVEILSDYIERNEYTHNPEVEAIRIATSALIEKESQKSAEKVDKLIDKHEQTKEPDEMSAVEVLEWFRKHRETDTMFTAFAEMDADGVFANYTADEIIDKITAYEAAKKEKPIELEWGMICRVIQICENGTKKVRYEEEISKDTADVLGSVEEILKKYISEHDGNYIAVIEDVCRVKGGQHGKSNLGGGHAC